MKRLVLLVLLAACVTSAYAQATSATALAITPGTTCVEKYSQTGITYCPIYFNLDQLQQYSTTGY